MTKYYFAEDGNWGDADGMAVVDTDSMDDHFLDQLDHIHEYDLAAWADWFSKNDHEFTDNGELVGTCGYCENFHAGSIADIDIFLSEPDEDEE